MLRQLRLTVEVQVPFVPVVLLVHLLVGLVRRILFLLMNVLTKAETFTPWHARRCFASRPLLTPALKAGAPDAWLRRFLSKTPELLIQKGLYRDIALAIPAPPHRAVGLAMVAMAMGLGATPEKAGVAFGTM